MEHVFGAGTLVRDAGAPHRYHRRAPLGRRPRAWAAAAGVAVSALLLLGGVAYGGSSNGVQHIVVHAGDTIWGITRAHYPGDDIQQRVAEVEAANHLHGGLISPGQILTLPAP